MNVIKLSTILFLYHFVCTSQTKKDDAFFILNNKAKDYVLKVIEDNKTNNSYKISGFRLYNRKEYEQRNNQIKEDKNKGKAIDYSNYKQLKELSFRVVFNSEREELNHCDTHFLNSVNYEWIRMNSWKENNPNILFKDLYFLLKIKKDKYLKFKVKRTVIIK